MEKPRTRSYSKLKPISVESFMKYMHLLTLAVEGIISKLLPDKFCISYDGWSLEGQSTHFIGSVCPQFLLFYTAGVIATFMFEGKRMRVLLGFTTMEDEDDFSATVHKQVLVDILKIFKKDLTNVVCLVSDNTTTNHKLATICGLPFVGIRKSILLNLMIT